MCCHKCKLKHIFLLDVSFCELHVMLGQKLNTVHECFLYKHRQGPGAAGALLAYCCHYSSCGGSVRYYYNSVTLIMLFCIVCQKCNYLQF